ncbi:MAG: hypothetical protein R2867_20750 [Caldilineaceae bacterium]
MKLQMLAPSLTGANRAFLEQGEDEFGPCRQMLKIIQHKQQVFVA